VSVVQYFLATGSASITAATAKTFLELPSPANCAVQIEELVIGCDVSTAGNMNIQWGTFATTGTGTAATPQKWRGDRAIDSSVTAAKVVDTVEPTTFTQGTLGAAMYPSILVPLPMYVPFQWPLDHEFCLPESTLFGIRLTSSVTGNASLYVRWRE
jgi:hypothetical protein